MNQQLLESTSVLELLAFYGGILEELRKRRVLRTVNNPVADYSEFLACRALNLEPAANSEKGYDAIDQEGKKYEIKARRIAKGSKPKRFSAIRKLEENHFDYLIAILFTHDFRVQRAGLFSRELVKQKAFWQQHVNGWILPISDSVWKDQEVIDITRKLQKLQAEDNA